MARQLNQETSNTEQLWPKELLINHAMASTLVCSICDGIPRECNTDGEGDILCSNCAEYHDDAVPNKALQKMINQLKIRCMITNSHGNEAEDVEGGVNVMVTQIKYNECDWIGMIKEWDQHEQECPFLVISCDKCNKYESQRRFMPQHLNHCSDMEISCPLFCGSSILRKNMEIHKRYECNETLLPCTNHGCKLQIPRKDLENHIKTSCKYKIDSQSNQLLRSQAMEYTACSNCKRTAHHIALFMCTKDECDSFGGIYCQNCGDLSHSIYDHVFDVNLDHIKAVSLSIINQNIERGMRRLAGTFGAMNEHKYGAMRTLCESSVIAAFFGGLVGEISDTTKAKAFGKVGKELIKGVNHGKQMTTAVTNFATDIAIHAAGGASIGSGIMFGIEVAWHSYRFWTGEIETWKEFGYHVAKSVVASIASGICNFVGTVVGAAVGTLIGGPIGTVIGGVIGGFIGGFIGAKLGRKAFDKIWKDEWIHDEQKQRTDLIKKSLYLFGILDVKHINDPEIFNEKRLKKKYRELAKIYHPDRNDGSPESHQQFSEINTALGVLLALLENKDKSKQVSKLEEVKAITWKYDTRKLRKELKSAQLMFIVDYLGKWNEKYTLERVLSMEQQDILAVIKEMNNHKKFWNKVNYQEGNKFAEVVKTWKEKRNTEDENIVAIANRNKANEDCKEIHQCDLQNAELVAATKEIDENEEKKENESIDGNDMEDLKNRLRKKNVLDVAKICEEYDEDMTLDDLIKWDRRDLLDAINEINNDESNEYKINAIKKNKFVKIVCEFAFRI